MEYHTAEIFFINHPAATEIYTLSLHDALPISVAIKLDSKGSVFFVQRRATKGGRSFPMIKFRTMSDDVDLAALGIDPSDRKSTRLNSSHANISYAVFCLKKKTPSTVHCCPSYH